MKKEVTFLKAGVLAAHHSACWLPCLICPYYNTYMRTCDIRPVATD